MFIGYNNVYIIVVELFPIFLCANGETTHIEPLAVRISTGFARRVREVVCG